MSIDLPTFSRPPPRTDHQPLGTAHLVAIWLPILVILYSLIRAWTWQAR